MCGKQTQPVYISDAGVGEAVVEVKGGEAGSKALLHVKHYPT